MSIDIMSLGKELTKIKEEIKKKDLSLINRFCLLSLASKSPLNWFFCVLFLAFFTFLFFFFSNKPGILGAQFRKLKL